MLATVVVTTGGGGIPCGDVGVGVARLLSSGVFDFDVRSKWTLFKVSCPG